MLTEVYEPLQGKACSLLLLMVGLNPSRHTNDGMGGKDEERVL